MTTSTPNRMNARTSSLKQNRFTSFIRRSISFLSESFEVRDSPKRGSPRIQSPIKATQQARVATPSSKSESKLRGGTTFCDIMFSIDLHMSIVQSRTLKELKTQGLAISENQFYDLLEELRQQVFNLARSVYWGSGDKIFVHDFLYVEECRSFLIIVPNNPRLSESLFFEWRKMMSEFRKRVYAACVRVLE